MDKIIPKDVQNSLDADSSDRTEDRKRKFETTHLKQRNNKLNYKGSPVYDLVKESKENSLNLLKSKRKQKQKEDIEKGKNF